MENPNMEKMSPIQEGEENNEKKIDYKKQNVESVNTEPELALKKEEVDGDAKNSERVILINEKLEKVKNALKDLGIKDILDDEVGEPPKDILYSLIFYLEILIRDQIVNLRLLNKKYEEKFGKIKGIGMKSATVNFKNITGLKRIPILESAYDFAYKSANKIDKIYDITLDHKYDTWKERTTSDMKTLQDKHTKKADTELDPTGGNKKRTRKMNKKSKANKSRKQ